MELPGVAAVLLGHIEWESNQTWQQVSWCGSERALGESEFVGCSDLSSLTDSATD